MLIRQIKESGMETLNESRSIIALMRHVALNKLTGIVCIGHLPARSAGTRGTVLPENRLNVKDCADVVYIYYIK